MDMYASGVEQRSQVRIGDAERDECMGTLTEHHVRGRLTVEELDRRRSAALAAVTETDLAALLTDLPGGTATRRPLAVGDDWWSLDPKVRAVRIARWAATPVSLAAGGVLVASSNAVHRVETGFAVGLAAAAMGYLTHVVMTRWPGKAH